MYFAARPNHSTYPTTMAGQSSMGQRSSNENTNKGLPQTGFANTRRGSITVPYPMLGNILMTGGHLRNPVIPPIMVPAHAHSKMTQFIPSGNLQQNMKVGHPLYGMTATSREATRTQTNPGPVTKTLMDILPAVNWPAIRPPHFDAAAVSGGHSAVMAAQVAPPVDGHATLLANNSPTGTHDGSLGVINGMQLGPVEKAVLHQAMYNQSKKQTPAMRRCDNCNVIFNSQMQAEMHYKGKKHAKVMYLKRCKETKISPTKLRDSTIAIMENANWSNTNTSSEEETVGGSPAATVPTMVDVGCIKSNESGDYAAKYIPTFSTNQNYFAAGSPATINNLNSAQKKQNELKVDVGQNQPCVIDGADNSPHASDNTCNVDCGLESQNVFDSCNAESPSPTEDESKLSETASLPQREPVVLPDPLPTYIKRIERPAVLKESLRCNVCDIYVNSENQMKQHVNSLRHKNIEQGIPTPPKPTKDDKPKTKAEQFRCEVCKVTLNSDIQLLQHLSSQRHKNMLEGRPPKPRWTPYERTQHALLRSAAHLRLSLKTIPNQTSPLLIPAPIPNSTAPTLPIAAQPPTIHPPVLSQNPPAHLKQTAFIAPDGSILQTREFVFVGTGAPAFTSPYPQHLTTPGQPQLIQPHHIRAAPTQPELAQILNAQCLGFDPRKLGVEWTVQ